MHTHEIDPAVAGQIPGIGNAEPKANINNKTTPASNGQAQTITEPDSHAASTAARNGVPGSLTSQPTAPAKAPAKSTKKPLLDPEKYRKAKAPAADEAFSEGAQTTIPVRKPGKRNFFRAHPDEEYRLYNVPVVEDDARESYIIDPDLEIPDDLERFIAYVNLVTCLSHKGTVFLWPYKNSTNDWSKSASRIARRAIGEWVRLQADMDANGYRVETAPAELRVVEPTWPKMTFDEILNTAFEDKVIDSLDHPVILSIRGLSHGSSL
jgi:hypothetical protein